MNSSEGNAPVTQVQNRPGKRARRLAYAGLLPFVFGTALIWIVRADAQLHVGAAMSAYAAVIVSFLGGIHWGFGIRRGGDEDLTRFVWGVVPSLVAWLAVLMPANAALVIHGLMLAVCYLVDRKVYPIEGAAQWLTLRFRLTVVAAMSCFLAAAGA